MAFVEDRLVVSVNGYLHFLSRVSRALRFGGRKFFVIFKNPPSAEHSFWLLRSLCIPDPAKASPAARSLAAS